MQCWFWGKHSQQLYNFCFDSQCYRVHRIQCTAFNIQAYNSLRQCHPPPPVLIESPHAPTHTPHHLSDTDGVEGNPRMSGGGAAEVKHSQEPHENAHTIENSSVCEAQRKVHFIVSKADPIGSIGKPDGAIMRLERSRKSKSHWIHWKTRWAIMNKVTGSIRKPNGVIMNKEIKKSLENPKG